MQRWLIGKDPDAGEKLRAEGEGGKRRWDGWMASLTQQTWVWTNSGRWWWTIKPGMLQPMGLQKDITEQLNNIWSYMCCTAFIASHYTRQSFACSATALENVYAILPIIFRFGSPGKNSETTRKYPCENLFPLKSWTIREYWSNEQKQGVKVRNRDKRSGSILISFLKLKCIAWKIDF